MLKLIDNNDINIIDKALELKQKYSDLLEKSKTEYLGLDTIFMKLSVIFYKLNLEDLSIECYLNISDKYFQDFNYIDDFVYNPELENTCKKMHIYYINIYSKNPENFDNYPQKFKQRLLKFLMYMKD